MKRKSTHHPTSFVGANKASPLNIEIAVPVFILVDGGVSVHWCGEAAPRFVRRRGDNWLLIIDVLRL